MKLFQIEEPDGTPQDAEGPGAAVGIDLADDGGAVAVAVGGNAEILPGSDGARRLAVVLASSGKFEAAAVAKLLLALRARAERQLARPVTHAVIAATAPDDGARAIIAAAAQVSGLQVLRLVGREEAAAQAGRVSAAEAAALGAAILAEDAAPAQS